MIEYVKAEESHIQEIASRMRKHDVDECVASGHPDAYDALAKSLACSSTCWTGIINGRPSVMFGVAPINVIDSIGAPWLLGTDDVLTVKREFLRAGRAHVGEWIKNYSILTNIVDARNKMSVRWLKRLGFEFLNPVRAGVNGEWFYPFQMVRA